MRYYLDLPYYINYLSQILAILYYSYFNIKKTKKIINFYQKLIIVKLKKILINNLLIWLKKVYKKKIK